MTAMTHDEALPYLPEYLRRELEPSLQTRVAGHVETCTECAEIRGTFIALEAALRASTEEVHPTSEEIVAAASNLAHWPAARLQAVRAHAERCERCRAEIEAVCSEMADTSAAEDKIVPLRRRQPRIPLMPMGLLAASVLVVLLSYPAYLGLLRYPESKRVRAEQRERIVTLKEQAARKQGGAVIPIVLSGGTRSTEEPTVVYIPPDRLEVALAIESFLITQEYLQHVLDIELRGADGVVVWSDSMSAGVMRDGFEKVGLVVIPVSESALPEGSYQLVISIEQEAEETVLQQIPFRVTRRS